MPALAESRQRITLLAVRGKASSWSVPGHAVAGIERLSDWSGDAPLDVGGLLGEVQGAGEDARVVVLQQASRSLPLLATGSLSLLETTAEQLLALPAVFQSSLSLVDRVAVIDGAPALFVLSPERVLQAWYGPAELEPDVPSPSSSR
jgi:hypothetical protein